MTLNANLEIWSIWNRLQKSWVNRKIRKILKPITKSWSQNEKKKTSEFLQEWRKRATKPIFWHRNAVFFPKNIVCLFKFIQKYLMVNTGPISELRDYIWHFSSRVINVSLDNAYIFLLYIWWTMTDTLHSDREWFQWERLNFTYW